MKSERKASCHPDRKHYAKDLCTMCYTKHHNSSEKHKEHVRNWTKSDKGKNWLKSEKGIEKYKRHYYSNKRKVTSEIYRNSYRGKELKRLREKRKYVYNKYYRLANLLRSRLRCALNRNSLTKRAKLSEYLGCTIEFLKHHLESQFQLGMTWENQGQWHIDHIIPLSSAKSEEEIYKLCHYTNLQPLWAKDNLSKGNKI